MVMTKIKPTEEMNLDIKAFKLMFKTKFNLNIKIDVYNNNPQPAIKEIESLMQDEFFKSYSKSKYPKGIHTATRKREVAQFRQMFMHICTLYKHPQKNVASYCKFNHATVYHANIVCNEQESVNNEVFIKSITNVLHQINTKYDGKAICTDRRGGVNPGSGIHSILSLQKSRTKASKFTSEQKTAFSERLVSR